MRIYLDNSFLNRPFDDPDIGTNKIEAEILSLVIKLVQKDKIKVVNSSIIEYENSFNSIPERKIFVEEILKLANKFQNTDEHIKKRAEKLVKIMNIAPIDALHLASSEAAKVDIFLTCDYAIIKKYKGRIKVINPLEFIQYYENTNR